MHVRPMVINMFLRKREEVKSVNKSYLSEFGVDFPSHCTMTLYKILLPYTTRCGDREFLTASKSTRL